jgi:hypothetical protein
MLQSGISASSRIFLSLGFVISLSSLASSYLSIFHLLLPPRPSPLTTPTPLVIRKAAQGDTARSFSPAIRFTRRIAGISWGRVADFLKAATLAVGLVLLHDRG